jgi:hypothetical protein
VNADGVSVIHPNSENIFHRQKQPKKGERGINHHIKVMHPVRKPRRGSKNGTENLNRSLIDLPVILIPNIDSVRLPRHLTPTKTLCKGIPIPGVEVIQLEKLQNVREIL